jgi:hypothetical protein
MEWPPKTRDFWRSRHVTTVRQTLNSVRVCCSLSRWQRLLVRCGTRTPSGAKQRQSIRHDSPYRINHLREEFIGNDLIWLLCESSIQSASPGEPHLCVDVHNGARLIWRQRMQRTSLSPRDENTIEGRVTIQRPVEKVFGFYRDFKNLPSFLGDVMAIEQSGQTS